MQERETIRRFLLTCSIDCNRETIHESEGLMRTDDCKEGVIAFVKVGCGQIEIDFKMSYHTC